MPNWCSNKLSIKKEYIDKVVADNEVSFDILVPMPEIYNVLTDDKSQRIAEAFYKYKGLKDKSDLVNLIIGDKKATKEDIDVFMHKAKSDYDNINEKDFNYGTKIERIKKYPTLYELGKAVVGAEKEYGSKDWYDWRCRNWGTKWDATDCDILYFTAKNGEEMAELQFDTAWCPPVAWLEALAKECPFYLEWVEEQGYHGEILCNKEGYQERDLEMERYVEDENGDIYLENEDIYTFDEKKFEVANW